MTRIAIEPSFAAWRRTARDLLRQEIAPAQIEWVEAEKGEANRTGHALAANRTAQTAGPNVTPTIPRELLARLRTAACYRAADRWSLLYRILWRWTHGERHALSIGDPDGERLDRRIQSVENEIEDMLTLTLFRRRDPSMGHPEFVGWYEPHHDTLERAAARFAERTGDSTWMLATPQGAAFWNGMLLRIGRPESEDGMQATPALTEALTEVLPEVLPELAPKVLPATAMTGEAITSASAEALWLAYYASVFNAEPAPVPLRYWRTPPAGPPLPAHLARERSRRGAQSGVVSVPEKPPVEYSALTPPLSEPGGPLATCRRCALWRNAHQAVEGTGPAQAALMVVGEQPGEYENQHGKPFTGPAGQLLDTVLARAGLEREALYLTYAVKHYKWETLGNAPGGALERQRVHRTPAPREVEACQYWLDRELAQVAPRVVVTLGATALKALTGAHVMLSEYLGQTIARDGRWIVPTWHPSYALGIADARLREDVVASIAAAFERAGRLAAEAA